MARDVDSVVKAHVHQLGLVADSATGAVVTDFDKGMVLVKMAAYLLGGSVTLFNTHDSRASPEKVAKIVLDVIIPVVTATAELACRETGAH